MQWQSGFEDCEIESAVLELPARRVWRLSEKDRGKEKGQRKSSFVCVIDTAQFLS